MVESLEELWPRALADAGFSPEELVLLALEGTPEERGAPGGSWARMQPGGVPAASDDWPFTEEELAPARERPDLPKVAAYTGVDPAALLALLRHSLQTVRQATATRTAYAFAVDASDALHRVYRESGPGGAVVYNAQPMMRDASAHAAALVTRVFGPQLGRLRDPEFGPLFRTDNEPEALEIFPRRVVVYAALHGGAVAQFLGGEESLEAQLQLVSPAAPRWWDRLMGDELFRSLSASAVAFVPTPEEIAAYGNAAGEAWRPLEDLLLRAHRYGMELTSTISA